MHVSHFKDVKLLLYMFETRYKVSGSDYDIKWVIGLLSGVVDTANKTPNLSSVFTDSQCILHFPSQMHMGHKKLGNYYYLCVKDACKVLRHNSISKWVVGATTIA